MEDRDIIMKFNNINVIDYLNKTHKSSDAFLIETQKHNLKKYMQQLNDELYKSFITNSEGLLEILNTYDYAHTMLCNINIESNLHDDMHQEVDAPATNELSNALSKYNDDMDAYITSNRYVLYTEYYNDKKYYIVLTNDILFIGSNKTEDDKNSNTLANNTLNDNNLSNNNLKNTKSTNNKSINNKNCKYSLEHVFNKSIINMYINNNILYIDVNAIKYELYGNIDVLFDIFTDTTYKSISDTSYTNINDLIKYFIITEQYDKLNNVIYNNTNVKNIKNINNDKSNSFITKNTGYSGSCSTNNKIVGEININLFNVMTSDELSILLNMADNKHKVFSTYVTNSFKNNISKINKIQELSALIDELFDYMEYYVNELEELYDTIFNESSNTKNIYGKNNNTNSKNTKHLNNDYKSKNKTENKNNKSNIYLIIQSFITTIFNFIEKRVFNKFYQLKITEDNLKKIEERLVFGMYNYHYLYDKLLSRREGFSIRCLDIAKKEISALLDGYIK